MFGLASEGEQNYKEVNVGVPTCKLYVSCMMALDSIVGGHGGI